MGNSTKGRDMILSVSEDDGVTWLPVAGIRTKEFTRENPVADSTNQATTGNETESCFTGYGTVTMSGSGTIDTRETGLYPYRSLATVANSGDPVIMCQLIDALGETYEGTFNITSFGKSTEQNALVEFSIALQNESAITFTPAPAP